ncbi:uncharacterized protein LOC141628501 [Silene latifolia]|uniref:uncharacterized protein LOC141628501 n=1 Tax=Silene latifolia TaxID=37657 RepID=UPI003D7759F6
MDGENLYEYRERFKELIASCPYHGYTDQDLLLNFCGGLLEDDARMIKAATRGGIEYMSVQEANDLIERLVGSSRNFGRRVKRASVASSSKQHSNHMEDKVDFLTNLIKELSKGNGSTSHMKFCGLCNDPTHRTDECSSLQTEEASEAVKALGFRKFDPYFNTYNEGWKAHPNFGWGGESLRSHTIPPPTKEQAQAVSLRNGRELVEAPKAPKKSRPLPIVHEVEDVVEDEIEVVVEHGKVATPEQERINEPLPEYEPQAPFPSALNDTKIIDKKTSSLYDIFRKVEVNIPLLDLLSSVPKHAKFLKELCTTKRANKAKSMKKVRASEHVSAMFQKRLPQKCGDPGMFNIPCKIGDLDCQRAMLDLGASINVLPH